MSDYPTESQLRSWNNDGMDPYWTPHFKEKERPKTIVNIENLINAAEEIVATMNKNPEHFSDENGFTRITLSNKLWNNLKKSLDDLK